MPACLVFTQFIARICTDPAQCAWQGSICNHSGFRHCFACCGRYQREVPPLPMMGGGAAAVFSAQPMAPQYGAQPMAQQYGAQPMVPQYSAASYGGMPSAPYGQQVMPCCAPHP